MEYIRITKENIDKEHICCAMSNKQSNRKKEWLKARFDEGLVFYRSVERGKCFIEYLPAEMAWVPIDAEGYLYINCMWIAGAMKGQGYANDLLDECIRDARVKRKRGLCILSSAEQGIPLKTVYIADRETAQNMPVPVTTYALFRDGKYITHGIQSDQKFLKLAGVVE